MKNESSEQSSELSSHEPSAGAPLGADDGFFVLFFFPNG
jgi:hypothetical protein